MYKTEVYMYLSDRNDRNVDLWDTLCEVLLETLTFWHTIV